jgi:hypothetical protein
MGVHHACFLTDHAEKVTRLVRNLAGKHPASIAHASYYRAPTGGRYEKTPEPVDSGGRFPDIY